MLLRAAEDFLWKGVKDTVGWIAFLATSVKLLWGNKINWRT